MTLGVHRGMVRLESHDSTWKDEFQKEKRLLEAILDTSNIVSIEHVGSTSIPGIAAKPLLDILVVVKNTNDARKWVPLLEKNDYHLREDVEDHLMLAKGPEYNRTIHLHIGQGEEEYVTTTILFRDYLLAHPQVAKEYEKLKKDLAAKYPNDRELYTPAKRDFINKIVEIAKTGKDWS